MMKEQTKEPQYQEHVALKHALRGCDKPVSRHFLVSMPLYEDRFSKSMVDSLVGSGVLIMAGI